MDQQGHPRKQGKLESRASSMATVLLSEIRIWNSFIGVNEFFCYKKSGDKGACIILGNRLYIILHIPLEMHSSI